MQIRRPTLKQSRAACARWNQRHPVGTAVIVLRDNQQEFRTRTRSEAFIVSGRAVVQVEGIAGSYVLAQVRAVEKEADRGTT